MLSEVFFCTSFSWAARAMMLAVTCFGSKSSRNKTTISKINREPRSSRSRFYVDADISKALKEDPRATSRELSATLKHPQRTIVNHLHEIGKMPKFGQLVPHLLTDFQKQLRCDLPQTEEICKKRTTDWIKDTTIGDENWVLYVNHTRKRQWVPAEETAKPDLEGELQEKKCCSHFWWDSKGVIFRELLPDDATTNADPYCTQLEKVVQALRLHRPRSSKLLQ
uniref:Histone-lysine N-methyltransferase SETMAR n=1 Tax=Caenorhabditis japonica TaxID=281687 RepID=A0A8R1EBJ7_CAEJA